jgi:hypothetical protein
MAFRHAKAYFPLKACLMSIGTGMCAAGGYVLGSSSGTGGSSNPARIVDPTERVEEVHSA